MCRARLLVGNLSLSEAPVLFVLLARSAPRAHPLAGRKVGPVQNLRLNSLRNRNVFWSQLT